VAGFYIAVQILKNVNLGGAMIQANRVEAIINRSRRGTRDYDSSRSCRSYY